MFHSKCVCMYSIIQSAWSGNQRKKNSTKPMVKCEYILKWDDERRWKKGMNCISKAYHWICEPFYERYVNIQGWRGVQFFFVVRER